MKHSYIDQYSNIGSFIHRLDPGIKIISFIMFILFIISTKPISFIAFALYGTLITILILISRIPIKFIFKRSLVFIPFVVMIAIFVPFFKTGKVAFIYSFGIFKIVVTYEGLMVLWNCLVKAYLSVLCMILLMSSTRFSNLLKAFEKLKSPPLITMIFSFMYRYIFVIQDELMKMHQAKEARSCGRSKWLHAKALGNMVGALFIKSYERAESVYLAMRSRGFDGKIKTMDDFKITPKDLFFLFVIIALLASIRLMGG